MNIMIFLTKDINFNEYYGFKQLFSEIKNQHIKFGDALKKQKKLNLVKQGQIGKNSLKQKDVI